MTDLANLTGDERLNVVFAALHDIYESLPESVTGGVTCLFLLEHEDASLAFAVGTSSVPDPGVGRLLNETTAALRASEGMSPVGPKRGRVL